MEPMRLQRFLSRAGVASRRHAEELIAAGRVSVNGNAITEMGVKVDPVADTVAVDGRTVSLPEGGSTLMLHKPAGFVTTMEDPQGRPTVADLVPTDSYPGLFPVGRLDLDTSGLLLFTTDGDLGAELLHPRTHVMKRYIAEVEGVPDEADLRMLRRGVALEDGPSLPAEVVLMEPAEAKRARALFEGEGASGRKVRRDRARRARRSGAPETATSLVAIGIREGRKRQVRRMFEAVEHPVISLHRVSVGPQILGGLKRGSWRELAPEEVEALRRAVR